VLPLLSGRLSELPRLSGLLADTPRLSVLPRLSTLRSALLSPLTRIFEVRRSGRGSDWVTLSSGEPPGKRRVGVVVPFTGVSAALRPRLQNGTFFSAGALVALFNMNELRGEESSPYFDLRERKKRRKEQEKKRGFKTYALPEAAVVFLVLEGALLGVLLLATLLNPGAMVDVEPQKKLKIKP
jgi:hypothetical protein